MLHTEIVTVRNLPDIINRLLVTCTLSKEELGTVLDTHAAKLSSTAPSEGPLDTLTSLYLRQIIEHNTLDIDDILSIILNMSGIQMSIDGCGCCGSPNFSFVFHGLLMYDSVEGYYFNNIDN